MRTKALSGVQAKIMAAARRQVSRIWNETVTAKTGRLRRARQISSDADIRSVRPCAYQRHCVLIASQTRQRTCSRHVGGNKRCGGLDEHPRRGAQRTGTHSSNPCDLLRDHYHPYRDLYLIAAETMKVKHIHQHYRHRAVRTQNNMHGRIIFTNKADLQLVQPVVIPVQQGHQNRTHLAGGQLLCRLRVVRRCQAVFGRARQCRLVQGVPDGSGQLHGYQIAVSVGLHPF